MQNKKRASLEQLYTEYYPLMYHTAFNILQDHGLAEDAVQDALLKLGKNNFYIDEIKCNKTASFLVIIVRNAALTIYAKNKKAKNQRLEDAHMAAADPSPTPLDLIITNINIKEIKEAIKAMDSSYADILILKYHYECSNRQIADLLSLSEGNVRVRLHRARKKLAAMLKNEVQV